MYKIKQLPEDFLVEEISKIKDQKKGDYLYFQLEKKNYSTQNAVQIISQFLKIPIRKIGFAGSKDKKAITIQYISIKDFDKNVFNNFKNKADFKFKYMGRGENPISLGDLEGNRFEIIIRNIDEKPKPIKQTINYYDDQRFSENNAEIGKCLIKGDYKRAVELIKDTIVKKFIAKNPNNYISALKKLQLKVLLFYIHAYQSYLFNETVKIYLQCNENKLQQCRYNNLQCRYNNLQCKENNLQCKENNLHNKNKVLTCKYKLGNLLFPLFPVKNIKIPLIGFGMEKPNSIIKDLMKKEKITERDFINRQIPDLSCEGDLRDLIINVKDLKIGRLQKDELNPGKKKCKISFFLQKGSYATIVIKNMFSLKP